MSVTGGVRCIRRASRRAVRGETARLGNPQFWSMRHVSRLSSVDLPVSNRLPMAGATAISAFLENPKGLALTAGSGGELVYRIYTGPIYDDVAA